MDKRHKAFLALLLLSLVLLCGCAGGDGKQPSGPELGAGADSGPAAQEGPEEGSSPEEEPAAVSVTFEGKDLEGDTVTQDIFSQSRLTMVNVWATYCGPCLREMPGLGELAAEYDVSEFQIVGVVSDVTEGDDQTLVESLVQETGADYTHLLANDSIGQALLSSVSAVPTTFFFDQEGTCLGGVVGSAERSQWEGLIHELLEGT